MPIHALKPWTELVKLHPDVESGKDSTLQRQAKDFVQSLTLEVANSTNAVMAYSFGGLQREAGSESLPPGVAEAELLAACVGPDLDGITACEPGRQV